MSHDPRRRFGAFTGVFTPTLLTILGVIMYIRLGWVVGNAGLIGAWLILILALGITLCTGLSLASIATNTRIGDGGPYAIIARSLGLEAAGSIGLPLFLTRPLGIAMYIFGFREGWLWIFPEHDPLAVDLITFFALWLISYLSVDLAFRVQYVIMGLIGLSLVSIFTNDVTFEPAKDPLWWGDFPGFPETGFGGVDFWTVFAVFFPATTGILAGANMSGELKDPRRDIPIGALGAIALSSVIYFALSFWAVKAGTTEELVSNYTLFLDESRWRWMVVAGLLGATASSALAGLVGGPQFAGARGVRGRLRADRRGRPRGRPHGDGAPAQTELHVRHGDGRTHREHLPDGAGFRPGIGPRVGDDTYSDGVTESEGGWRERLLAKVLDLVPAQLFVIDRDGTILVANEATARSFASTVEELEGSDIFELLSPEREEYVRRELALVLTRGQEVRDLEDTYIDATGSRVVVQTTKVPLVLDDGSIAMLGISVDVSEQRAAEGALKQRAFYDLITGLPNRELFVERLQHALKRSTRSDAPTFALLFMDLDSFKEVNDTLGHLVGDQVLVETAARLQRCVRPADTVSRFGGDEFAVLLESGSPEKAAATVADRIHGALALPTDLGDHKHFVSTSIGIAVPGTDTTAGDLLRDADAAMYVAKQGGPGRTEFFSEEIRLQARQHLVFKNELQHGLIQRHLFLQYQPIIRLNDGALRGFEALVRWKHPTRGVVSPAEFLPVAASSGLMPKLEGLVLDEVCRQLRQWIGAAAPKRFRVSINVSSEQLAQRSFADDLAAAVQENELHPSWIIVELTESSLIENAPGTRSTLKALRATGVKIALDDFGTGFSSLSHLHRFPIDIIKIDRSFTSNIERHDKRARILAATLQLGRDLGLMLTAEGVETEAQRQWLREHGCDYGQGWLFDRALDPEIVEERLVDGWLTSHAT
ncbi:MAG: EAL domain-containing protein [Proteobacteria bacterium]|nr:EAL domain-containing protein [Pseudomonadota bacterium]